MKNEDIYALISRPTRTRKSSLSVYLNMDQSDPTNLNRGFEKKLRDMASALTRSTNTGEREPLAAAMNRVKKFVSSNVPAASGLAIFADEADGFFWHKELAFPVAEQMRWDRELLLQPLINAMDDLEGYAVVLIDRTKLRLFLVQLGKLEEFVHKDFDQKLVRHVKATGSDRAESSNHMQRKADNQVRSNLREVVRALDRFAKSHDIYRFLLAGSPAITAELRKMLPAHLAAGVIGTTVLPTSAPPVEVLAAAQILADEYERKTEIDKVNSVTTAAAKRDTAVVGLSLALHAINAGRVWELIYSKGLSIPGFECTDCAALFAAQAPTCAYCSSAVDAVDDVVALAVEHAIRKAARIEVVSGDAATTLTAAGGIAAFLKTRAGAVASR
jgi:peptide subunit release factor 1 (eRF1)